MANRPNRNRTVAPKKRTQAEINRITPKGELSLSILEEKSARVLNINVQLPDGEVWAFYHLPMSMADARDFFEASEKDRLTALRDNVHTRLVKKDGTPFADDPEVWENVDVKIVDALCNAMLNSAKEEAGED